MKLKDYIKSLQKLVKKYPEAECFYSIDEEGNGYESVYFGPSIQYADKDEVDTGRLGSLDMNDKPTNADDVAIVILN